jgi:excinuclease UvrABC nuclease subunit
MIQPQEIDLKQLPSILLEDRKSLPNLIAVYFVLDDNDNVLYIGQAKNVRNRWLGHHKTNQLTKLQNVKIAYLAVDKEELLYEIEKACINLSSG